MAENKHSGCFIWTLVAILISTILGIAGTQFTVNSPTSVATPTPSPIVETITPYTTDTYFAVENNQIIYSYYPTLDWPCNYLMGGEVFDLEGQPIEDFVVNIHMIEIEEVSATASPGYASPYRDNGVLHWNVLLPSMSVDYEIWMTTKIGGMELSPHIYIETQDCYHNEARINFVQVKPLPSDLP